VPQKKSVSNDGFEHQLIVRWPNFLVSANSAVLGNSQHKNLLAHFPSMSAYSDGIKDFGNLL